MGKSRLYDGYGCIMKTGISGAWKGSWTKGRVHCSISFAALIAEALRR